MIRIGGIPLAIADVLVHQTRGLVSYQPAIGENYSNEIPVRDVEGNLFWVDVWKLSRPKTREEIDEYWKIFNALDLFSISG